MTKRITWEELIKASEQYGWHLNVPEKEVVDAICKESEYRFFPKRYDEFLGHSNIPLRIYKDGLIACDINDVRFFPQFINIVKDYDKILNIIKNISN